jgi:hypothetical protein
MKQITTQKKTHGMVITICNYDEYQDIIHYKNDTVNETDIQDEMKQKRHRNDTILDKNANKNAKEKDTNTLAQKFDQFWTAYPKKMSKGRARKAFYRIKPSELLLAKMLATIEKAKTSEDWTKEKGQYVPYPEKWLNAEGWEDEIIPTNGNGSKPYDHRLLDARLKYRETTNCGATLTPEKDQQLKEYLAQKYNVSVEDIYDPVR